MRFLAPWILGAVLLAPAALASGAIHGTVYTRDGASYTGPIRWDKNENFWDDALDARKERAVATRGSRKEVKVFGLKISTREDDRSVRSQFSVPFGHLAVLEPRGGSRARLTLKSGEEIDILQGSSDIGDGVRGIVVDSRAGIVELEWDGIDRVEFSQAPEGVRDAERIYGSVETRRARFTGYVVWDRDESLLEDVLDGESDGRKYKVPFSKVGVIERLDDDAALLRLTNGRTLELSGSNDVDEGNRGIDVTIPGVGVVTVDWDEFRSLTLAPAPPSRRYDEFDGGRKLYGTVRVDDGESFTGTLMWDRDEEYTWEALDGEGLGVGMSIRFDVVDRIARESRRSTRVILADGQSFVLAGSNDVNDDNKGIVIAMGDGTSVEIDWDEFVEAILDR